MRLGARIARLEQRRKMQATKRFPEACTCFPADEQPGFKWRAEAEIARASLSGVRNHSASLEGDSLSASRNPLRSKLQEHGRVSRLRSNPGPATPARNTEDLPGKSVERPMI